MEDLNLESILAGPSDTELHQFRILHALKERREQFPATGSIRGLGNSSGLPLSSKISGRAGT